MRVKIQPRELKDLTLPYPYFVSSRGLIGRQDFWKGKPYKLLGFSAVPKAGSIDLMFSEFWKKPQLAVGMYPVFSDKNDNWTTLKDDIANVSVIESKK